MRTWLPLQPRMEKCLSTQTSCLPSSKTCSKRLCNLPHSFMIPWQRYPEMLAGRSPMVRRTTLTFVPDGEVLLILLMIYSDQMAKVEMKKALWSTMTELDMLSASMDTANGQTAISMILMGFLQSEELHILAGNLGYMNLSSLVARRGAEIEGTCVGTFYTYNDLLMLMLQRSQSNRICLDCRPG